MSDKTFRPWDPVQQILFPPSISDFVPKGHLAHFIRYARMKKREPELAQLVAEWMEAARSADKEEDQELGPGRRGDEMPEHI